MKLAIFSALLLAAATPAAVAQNTIRAGGMTTDSVVDAVNAMEEDNYQVPLVPSGETTFRGLGEDTEHRQLSGKSGKSSGKGSGKGGKSSKSGRLLEGDEAMEVDEEHRMLSHKSAKSSGKGSGKGSKSSKAR